MYTTLGIVCEQVTSHSLELAEARRCRARSTRKVKSYEDVADYDVLQITEFSRGHFYNTDYDVISELASPTSSKVSVMFIVLTAHSGGIEDVFF